VTTGILIIHTPSQLEQASSLVDLLEASLSLPNGAIHCSSLPGYAWSSRSTPSAEQPAQFTAMLDGVGAAIALVDGATVHDPQLCFDLAAAWARGKRIALLADSSERRDELPAQLGRTQVVARVDRAGLVAMVEDLAFELGLSPRLGQDAQRALEVLSSAPPPADKPTNGQHSQSAGGYAVVQAVPETAAIPIEAVANDEITSDDEVELSDADFEPLREPETAKPSNAASRELSLEAGRAISECSFHRDEGGDLSDELERSFGRFIDSVGGNWGELKRLGDVELWLGATDNLLESLPQESRHISEWYELGFQFSTLRSIAEHGLPADPMERAVYQELWDQSMTAFRESAKSARVAAREARRVQALLENLIGPEPQRDYTNVARSLHELRSLAAEADRL
jgi:hypothetical protein